MVRIAGGSFMMGEDPQYPEEGPPRRVSVGTFWIDAHELTNAEFARFVKATGYRTMAERAPPVTARHAARDARAGFGGVRDARARTIRAGGAGRSGAQWRHPSGPQESIAGRDARAGRADRL